MATTDDPTTTTSDNDLPAFPDPAARARWFAAAAALVLDAAAITGTLAVRHAHRTISDYPPGAVALTVPGSNGTVNPSCVQFDVNFLREMPVALAGTVTSVSDARVTLNANRWYHGSEDQQLARVVTLAVPGGQTSVALDGVDSTEGQKYLLAATDGTVNGCGFSGPAHPQLEAAYDQAFGS